MKNAHEKLLTQLEKCSDNRDETIKSYLMSIITQSSDYKELSRSITLKKPFDDYYSLPVLESLDINTLALRGGSLHKLVVFQSQLLQCIHAGNGPELSSRDCPDFMSKRSITRFINKISLAPQTTNYSNISDENALALFSNTTIKNAQKCFDMLPVSLTSRDTISEEEICQYMGNTLFCVSIEEFTQVHREFRDFASRSEQIVTNEQTRKKKHVLLKLAVVMICFESVFSFSQFGLFSQSYIPVLYIWVLISAIVYMIWG